ncbi:SAM-dependent methyltransferase [Myxococcota bacterium]|nr:SAM-dependent methyltransferase [Myxococcota bacterium]
MKKHARPLPDVPPDFPRPLLHALHLLTRDGALNADARRKLKQIEHLLTLLTPAVTDVLQRFADPQFVDAGAGKAYLGLMLAQKWLRGVDKGRLFAVESRADLAARAETIARDAGLERVTFVPTTIEAAPLPERLHLVCALHACDTATDDALALAIRRGADYVAVVPCCQAEVARLLAAQGPGDPIRTEAVAPLYRHAWHRREFGAHLTNVIRALTLEAHGYQVTVTELAGWEHSLKNELILGRRVHRENRPARARLDELLAAFGVRPALVRLLDASVETAAASSTSEGTLEHPESP